MLLINFMPQMKPMKWLYLSIIIYMNFLMILCLMNSFPLKLKNMTFNNYSNLKKWNWLW